MDVDRLYREKVREERKVGERGGGRRMRRGGGGRVVGDDKGGVGLKRGEERMRVPRGLCQPD